MTTIALPSAPVAPQFGFGSIMKATQDFINKRVTARSVSHLDAHLMRDIGLTPPAQDPHVALLRAVNAR